MRGTAPSGRRLTRANLARQQIMAEIAKIQILLWGSGTPDAVNF